MLHSTPERAPPAPGPSVHEAHRMGSSPWEYVAVGVRAAVVATLLGAMFLALPALVAWNTGFLLGFPFSPFWTALPVIALLALAACIGASILSGTREASVSDTHVRFGRWDRAKVEVERTRLLRPVVLHRWLGIAVVRYRGRRRPLRFLIITPRQAEILVSLPEYPTLDLYAQYFTWWGSSRRATGP
jgi:hypothetical protein